MKIQIDPNDIEKVLKTFCPGVKYSDGKIQIGLGGSGQDEIGPQDGGRPEKVIELEKMDLNLKSRVRYRTQDSSGQTISGDLDLNLDRDGFHAELKLD